MSKQAFRFKKTKTFQLQELRKGESGYEMEDYFILKNKNSPKLFKKQLSQPLDDRYFRSSLFAYMIMGGNFFLSLPESRRSSSKYWLAIIELLDSFCQQLWGAGISPLNMELQPLLTRVIDVLDWMPEDEGGLLNLVAFTNALPNHEMEDWEISGDWESWISTRKLLFSVDNTDESLTVERDPELKNYRFNVLDVAKKEVCDKTETLTPLMGVELEFNTPNWSLDSLIPVLGMGIFKSDSTTDVEFVTVPLEYQDLVRQFKQRETAFNRMLQNNGADSNGMHVHVSRNVVTLAQEARIYYLINARKNRDYWSRVADRDVADNEYCYFVDLSSYLINAVKNNDFSNLGNSFFPSDRRITVNRQNPHTLEFRLFKSPNNLNKVLDNLRIVQAVLDYTAKGGYTLHGFIRFRASSLLKARTLD